MKKENNLGYLAMLVMIFFILFGGALEREEVEIKEVSYNEFLTMAKEGEIEEISVDLKNGNTMMVTDKNEEIFTTENPKYENFKVDMLTYGINVVENTELSILEIIGSLFSLFYPVMIIGFLVYAVKSFKTQATTSIKKNTLVVENPNVTFEDVAGLKPVKKDLELVVEFLKEPTKFTKRGAKLPKGIILYGSPGTGKTLLARAVAGEADVPFFSLSGSDFIELYVGVGAKRVRELFEQARKNSPCIIFIDEIDAIGSKRGDSMGNNEQRQTINALLSEMDGFNGSEGVLVICATNRKDDLDNALVRPGRFDKHIYVPIPDTPKERMEIINIYKKNKEFSEDVDFEVLSKETIGFSPADIETLINEATLISIQDNKNVIDRASIDKAIYKKLLQGHAKGKDETNRDKEEVELIAWHEAGHAVIGKLFDMDISKVTITPSTSGAGGVNIIIPKKMGLHSVEEIENMIKMSYGGRVAEYLLLGDKNKVTTGASNDILQATRHIKKMVCEYGMTDAYKMVNLYDLKIDGKKILEEVVDIANRLEKETEELLTNNIHILKRVVKVLLDKETISGTELDDIFKEFK